MTRIPNVEPLIESDEREYRDSGVPSTVAIAGHPLHPVIVTFPVAFLVTVLATDAAYWLTDDGFWARMSFWLIAGGLVSGVVAAITGMLDFIRIGRVRERRAGWAHMVGNIGVLGLTLINFLLRLNNVEGAVLPTGLILSAVVSVLLGITGWYGGELVYRHKVAVIGDGSQHSP
ncbi:MAG: DUF2231 domain-containing protein [Leptolyngbyaceae cyanobacterium SL_7_1]|nr:DUF2231 domain-containing protein [Leptolyngbyaceae cyanobacterium SL_7_1]